MRRVVLRIADVGSPVLRLTGTGGWASGREGPNRKPRTLRKGQLNRHTKTGAIHVHNRDDATVKSRSLREARTSFLRWCGRSGWPSSSSQSARCSF